MLDLVETLFARYGIRSLRYDGRMSREARELALAEFRQHGGPKVILVRYARVLFAFPTRRCPDAHDRMRVQHEMRWSRSEPCLCQSRRQVSAPRCVAWTCADVWYCSMDLAWNYATESQAYDRVHRLGQEKEVFVKRLVVKNTIEER